MLCLDVTKNKLTCFQTELVRAATQARCYLWVVSHGGERAQRWGHNKVISVWRAGAPGIPWSEEGWGDGVGPSFRAVMKKSLIITL